MPPATVPIPIPKELLAPKDEAYYEKSTHGNQGSTSADTGIGTMNSGGMSSNMLPESDQYAATVTTEMACRCPHLDAYLPHYLDTAGLGLFQKGDTHPLKHHSKRQKRMTMSDIHLSSILPIHKKKVGGSFVANNSRSASGGAAKNKNSTVKQYSQYTFGDEEKKTDAIMMGGVAEYYTPIHTPTFVEQVEKERRFEMELLNSSAKLQQEQSSTSTSASPHTSSGGSVRQSKNDTMSSAPMTSTNINMQYPAAANPIPSSSPSVDLSTPILSNQNHPDLEDMHKKIAEYRSALFLKSRTGSRRKGRRLSNDSSNVSAISVGGSSSSPKLSHPSLSPSRSRSANVSNIPPNLCNSIDNELQEQVKQRGDDINAALTRVEQWLEVIRLNRMQYWRQQHRKKQSSDDNDNNSPMNNFNVLDCNRQDKIEMDDFQCTPCVKKSSKRKSKSSLCLFGNNPKGDGLMQCLDCSEIFCGSGDLAPGSNHGCKRHMQKHFLLSNHSLAITCGSQAKIFCMKCGDYVYHDVLQREIERVEIEMNLPWFSWDRHKTLQRSFGFSHRLEDDFVVIPDVADEEPESHEDKATKGTDGRNSMVVWRGFRATYPNPVPDEIVVAAKRTLRRLKLFRGEAPSGRDYINFDASSAEMALQQHARYPQKYWNIDCPVGIYNAGNICYISSVLQCIFNLRSVQKYFLRDAKHDHRACAVLRSSLDEPPKHCLACEMDKLMLKYYGSSTGISFSTLCENPPVTGTESGNHSLLGHESDTNASSPQSQQGMPITCSDFLVAAWQSNDMLHLAGNDQHDAHEFMQAFLDIIDKECKRFHNTIAKGASSLTRKPWNTSDVNNTPKNVFTSVSSLFAGNLRSVLMCDECGYKRSHLEPFLNVSLSLPTTKASGGSRAGNRRPSSRIDVRSCIDLFSEAEPLSDGFFCPWCKKKTKTHKQHTFAKLPTVLCLHLKRFCATTNKKIDDQVMYPSTLDMGPYLPHWREIEQTGVAASTTAKSASSKSKKNKVKKSDGLIYPNMLYDLCGTINHSGTLNQGHYVANVKVDKDWYSCNDTEVNRVLKEATEKELNKSEEVYMLFYQRRL